MPSPGSLAILTLKDKNGISYEMKVDLKYDVITRNNNYIEDLFGFEDIHKKYTGHCRETLANHFAGRPRSRHEYG